MCVTSDGTQRHAKASGVPPARNAKGGLGRPPRREIYIPIAAVSIVLLPKAACFTRAIGTQAARDL